MRDERRKSYEACRSIGWSQMGREERSACDSLMELKKAFVAVEAIRCVKGLGSVQELQEHIQKVKRRIEYLKGLIHARPSNAPVYRNN